MNMAEHRKKIITYWLILGASFVFLMVAIGGITRLTHSGLSMTDWNLFIGSIPPLTDAEWLASFEHYKQFPEFKELNYNFTLEDYKSIFWWEYIHRVMGRLIGLVFLFPFLFFLFKGWLSPKLKKQLFIVFLMGGFQAFLGWFMVKSGLVDMPRVSHFRLAAHLLMAFMTCLYISWLIWEINLPRVNSLVHELGLRKQAVGLFVLVIIQSIYGAFVAGLKAGWVHNTFPLMDGQIISDAVFALEPVYLNFIQGKSGVQFVHRVLGISVLVWVIIFYFKGIRSVVDKFQILSVRLVFIAALLQVSLGIATLMLRVPISFGVLHQIGALFLLVSLVFSIHRFTPPSIQKN